MSNRFSTVQTNEQKIDYHGLLRGKPVFAGDMIPKDALCVRLVHSPFAHARILSFDLSKALAIEGVSCILTHKDLPRIPYTRAGQGYPEPSPYDTVLLDSKVRFVGDVVAIVAAVDEKTADRAVQALQVEYEELPPVLDYEKAMDSDAPVVHDETDLSGAYDPQRNLAAHYEMTLGDVDLVYEQSQVKMERTYYYPKSQQVPMEPHTAFSYFDDKNRLVVVSSTQVPFHARRILSRILAFPLSRIRVIKPRIGGGFGAKQGVIIEGYVGAVTVRTSKPAYLVFSREESFLNTYTRHDMRLKVRVGATRDGKICSLDLHALSNTGAYGDHALTVIMVCGSKTLPLYNKVEAVRFVGDAVYTNLPSAGAYRGYGAPQGIMGIDGVLDELAIELNMDPLELKAMNAIREGEGSPIFKIMGEGREGVEQVAASCKLDLCIEEGKKIFDWERKRLSYPKKEGSIVRGVGCALAMQGSGIAKIDMAAASLKMNDDGSFNLHIGATDLGTGSDTILSQIAAEVLSVPMTSIIVHSSDTDFTPFDTGAYASSTTYVSGNAVLNAAKKVKEQILLSASEIMGEPIDQLEVHSSHVRSSKSGKSIHYGDLCTQLFYTTHQRQIAATESYVGQESPIPFMASFMEVEVDLETGIVRPIETVSVVDCGTPINPQLALGQIFGATMQGIGTAFHEEMRFDQRGRPINASLFRYKIPDRTSYGEITAKIVDSYEPSGPFGAKSVSEIGIDTPTIAVLNAIDHATGVRLRRVPVCPEDLLQAITEKTKGT